MKDGGGAPCLYQGRGWWWDRVVDSTLNFTLEVAILLSGGARLDRGEVDRVREKGESRVSQG
jgi:hypothetical protein